MAYKQKGYSAFTQVNESKKDSLRFSKMDSLSRVNRIKQIQQLQDKHAINNAEWVFKDKNGKIINMDSMLLNPPRPTPIDPIRKKDKDFVGEY